LLGCRIPTESPISGTDVCNLWGAEWRSGTFIFTVILFQYFNSRRGLEIMRIQKFRKLGIPYIGILSEPFGESRREMRS
jgi:hypothetical protein